MSRSLIRRLGKSNSGITGLNVHHVKVTGNIVHDNVMNGIFLGKSDFLTIEGNTVYGNAIYGATSGIHLKAAFNSREKRTTPTPGSSSATT